MKALITGWCGGRFKIIHQTHRQHEFGKTNCDFSASNGMRIISQSTVAVSSTSLFVRGSNTNEDNYIIQTSQADRVKDAILEYNNHFSRNRLEIEDVCIEYDTEEDLINAVY